MKSISMLKKDIKTRIYHIRHKTEKVEFEKNENSEYDPRERVYVGRVVAIDNKGRRLTGVKIH